MQIGNPGGEAAGFACHLATILHTSLTKQLQPVLPFYHRFEGSIRPSKYLPINQQDSGLKGKLAIS